MRVSGLHLIRRQQRALAKWVLALFCLVWIQAALAPCAMAVVPDGMAGSAEEHCSYCPPTDAAGTHSETGAAATCAYPDQPQADGRASPVAPLQLALTHVAFALGPIAEQPASLPGQARPPDRAGPTIAVSYCRFLK